MSVPADNATRHILDCMQYTGRMTFRFFRYRIQLLYQGTGTVNHCARQILFDRKSMGTRAHDKFGQIWSLDRNDLRKGNATRQSHRCRVYIDMGFYVRFDQYPIQWRCAGEL